MQKILISILSLLAVSTCYAVKAEFYCELQKEKLVRGGQVLIQYFNNTPTGIYDAHKKRLDPLHDKSVITYIEINVNFADGTQSKRTFNEINVPFFSTTSGDRTGHILIERRHYDGFLPYFLLTQKLANEKIVSSLEMMVPFKINNYPDHNVKLVSSHCVDSDLKVIPDSIKKAFASRFEGHSLSGSWDGSISY